MHNAEGYDDDQTENQSYMSEIDETEILAAKKRLNFYDKHLNNPVSLYAQGQARKQGAKLKKKLYPYRQGDSSSSELTLSLI